MVALATEYRFERLFRVPGALFRVAQIVQKTDFGLEPAGNPANVD